MYKNILQSIDNIEIWPLISLVIFFLFFLGVLIFVLRTDKNFIRKMKELPLDDNDSDENKKSEK